MDNIVLLAVLMMFSLTLIFLAVFARPETATELVKTLRDVITRLFKHYLP